MWFDKPSEPVKETMFDYWPEQEKEFLKEYYCESCGCSFLFRQCPQCKREAK
jgi:hypothetical protein